MKDFEGPSILDRKNQVGLSGSKNCEVEKKAATFQLESKQNLAKKNNQ